MNLPAGYYLDEVTDSSFVFLRREDESIVAVFSAWGATREAIEEAAWRDFKND